MNKTIEDLKPVLTLALEALELSNANHWWGSSSIEKAITAIREALADQCVCGEPDTPGTHRTDGPCLAEQPAQQAPVVMHEDWYDSNSCGHCGMVGGHANTCRHYKPTPAQQQEPVATIYEGAVAKWNLPATFTGFLYTSPPASKPWVGLNLDDRERLRDKYEDWSYPSVLLSEVENILREKNA